MGETTLLRLDSGSDEVDNIGLSCALETFQEYEDVKKLIKDLISVHQETTQSENACQRFITILNQYQEQPHLLDKYLDDFLSELLTVGRNSKNDIKLRHLAFKFLYIITKVRGFKVVVRHLPHQVSDLEEVLSFLEEQDPTNCETWETRYMLLLWLSIVVMIPFHMSRLDNTTDPMEGKSVMKRILDAVKSYLRVGDKARDAAAFLSSHFIIRPDVMPLYMNEYLEWCMQVLKDADPSTMSGLSLQSGILSSLALIFKHGKREDIKHYGPLVLKNVISQGFSESSSTIVRKMFLKLAQRIGLSFLRMKVANWRYNRGTRCLLDNLGSGDGAQMQPIFSKPDSLKNDNEDETEQNFDVPDEIEDVIEQLLVGLRDKDTVLRWSAAKGIGRITDRLPKELADDVVTSVMDLFTPRESDSAWHGGCLALAELGRRGLVLPQHLSKVIIVVCKALVYDELRGNFSVGAHIRDAACYVCWSFARAYDPQILKPFINRIASALLVNTLFDREINCRRAASAAFQENVGRQGTLPHGIEILTIADYYSVGSRTNAFLQISAHIGQFPEYSKELIDHLLEHKVGHWDPAIRELAAKALHNLTFTNHLYILSDNLPKLLQSSVGIDLNARHGAILALAEIIYALSLNAKKEGTDLLNILDGSVVTGVRNIVFFLKTKRYFGGLGGILNLCAMNMLIKRISQTSVVFHNDQELIAAWLEVLDISLRHAEESVRSSAAEAIPHYCHCFIPEGSPDIEKLISNYCSQLKADRVEIRCGYALALGSLPYYMLRYNLPNVLSALAECAAVDKKYASWAEARRDAVRAISQITNNVLSNMEESNLPLPLNTEKLYNSFLSALDDYTVDSRGEVGAIVREAAMQAVQDVTLTIACSNPELLPKDVFLKIMPCILQQCVEKIDRTRSVAGSAFSSLIHNETLQSFIVSADQILEIFPKDLCDQMNWAAPSDTFHLFVKLLSLKEYTYNLLMGLIVSIGGLSESLVKYSRSALIGYLTSLSEDDCLQIHIASSLLSVLKNNLRNDRILISFFKTMDYLFTSGVAFHVCCEGESFHKQMIDMVWQSSSKSGDPQKLFAAINVLCSLLHYDESNYKQIIAKLSIFLCHRFPRVRVVTASKMYETFLSCDTEILPDDGMDDIFSLLSETDWNQSVDILRPIRNLICEKLDVPVPVLKQKQPQSKD